MTQQQETHQLDWAYDDCNGMSDIFVLAFIALVTATIALVRSWEHARRLDGERYSHECGQ